MSTRSAPRCSREAMRPFAIAAFASLAVLGAGGALAGAISKTAPVAVSLDLVPGDPANRVVLDVPGSVAVAVLGSGAYDVASIEPSSLRLGDAPANKERIAYADVDGDGRIDLVFRVRKSLLRLSGDAKSVTLRGAFRDGRPLAGSAPILAEPRALPDPVHEKLPVVPVTIDLVPGDSANLVDRGAPSGLTVGIRGGEACDVAKIDTATLNLAGAPVGTDEDGDPLVASADLDGDGVLDLVATFPRQALRLAPGAHIVHLRGAFHGGRELHGSDAIVLQGSALPLAPSAPSATATFTNPAPITIPAGAPPASSGPASPYPSSLVVSNLTGFVQFVSVTLHGLSHSFPDDVDVLLVGPQGQNLVLMSDTGGSSDAPGVTLSFHDGAPALLADEGALESGTYRPTNIGGDDPFPAPAPTPSPATSLSVFNGTEPNGTWRLYIVDDNGVDFGSLAGGWSLTIATSVTQVCNVTPILVPGAGTIGVASPYPSTIHVSGLLGTLTHATVTLQQFVHPYPDDVDFMVAGPQGENAIVMSDAGGPVGTGGVVTLTLDDAAAVPLPDETPLQSGTFRPANYGGGDDFPAPAPLPTGNTALSVFNGREPNGDWSLWGIDDAIDDGGVLHAGWCLTLTTTTCASGAPCDDGNPCTDDRCEVTTGRCTFVPDDGNACTDGNGCTRDACVGGACASEPGPGTFGFSNPASIAIPAGAPVATNGPASPYPSTIAVPPLGGAASGVEVTLHGFSHTFPDDVDVLLVGPGGQNIKLMSDAGLDGNLSGATLTFSDAADASLPDSDPIVPGVYRPTNFGAADPFPAPAPAPSGAGALSIFDGTNPAGVWRLFIVDDASQDFGAVSGGWSLALRVDCDDHDACTVDTCTGQGCVHEAASCDDGNPCTDDACDPASGCVRTHNDDPCDDATACTGGDRCEDGACIGSPVDCDDRNPCTADRCVAESGCEHLSTTDPCSDGDPCTANDRCDNGECVPGPPDACDDGNVCTDDACAPGVGCVHTANSAPCSDGDACTAGDACAAGACRAGTAVTCDDGNVCTDDACAPGAGCVFASNNSCNTRGNGYWKQLCRGPHSGDVYTPYDVDCVNDTCTFASVQTVADLCDRLHPDPPSDKCEQAEGDFMGLLLNLCRARVTAGQSIDSRCGPHTTVEASRAAADAALCDPARDAGACLRATCAASEVTSGEALGANSLRVRVEGTGIRLQWELPYAGPDGLAAPRRFRVFRRAAPDAPAVQIGELNPGALSFLDAGAASGVAPYVYEVVSVW